MTNKNIYMNLGGLDPELVIKAAPGENTAGRKRRKRSVRFATFRMLVILPLRI